MNFNILNPANFYSSQEVQRNVQPIESESNTENGYVEPIAPRDTVTLSQRALSGEQSNEKESNTYENLVAAQRIANNSINVNGTSESEVDIQDSKPEALDHIDTTNFLGDAMKSVLDGRLGVSTEKRAEIEAIMEEVAEDDSLSAEEKEERIAVLQEMLDKEYEKGMEQETTQ